jgi:hypothetical protein
LIVLASGHPEYVARNPNGANVPGVKAIGHNNPAGGGSENKFGSDFKAAGKRWNQKLCSLDSDGDGQSNGLELGDPCCIWAVGQIPQNTTDISHPGDKSSVTSRKCDDFKCANGNDPCKVTHLRAN